MVRFVWMLQVAFVAIALVFPGAVAAKRLALVVGIDSYENIARLQKARNDAVAMDQALRRAGFAVTLAQDSGRREFLGLLNGFYNQIEPGDEVAFFYAGHGVQIDGRNWLLPSDIGAYGLGDQTLLMADSIAVDDVLQRFQARGAEMSVLILDACRDNPFQAAAGQRSFGARGGLARIDPPEGVFVLYSAGVGQAALDRLSPTDPNPNSVFTRALLPLMDERGLSLPELARKVRASVDRLAETANHDQFPAYYDQMRGDFFFHPANRPLAPAPAEPLAQPGPCAQAAQIWSNIQASQNQQMFQQYLRQFPNCPVYSVLARNRLEALQSAVALAPRNALPNAPWTRPTGDQCFDLWYQRNAVFQRYGFCFETPKALRYFDVSRCITRSPQLSPADKQFVQTIKAQERAAGCL